MISSSGILKRSLAATAISALAVAGIPALAGTAHAAVGVTVASLGAYDLNEFTTGGDDIVVTVKDGATPIDINVEYDVAFTPEVGPTVPADGVYAPGGDTGPDGIVDLTFDPALAGSYTVTVRTVGTHVPAPAFTFVAGQAAIKWADGASATSPQNGSDTYAGTLALTTGAPGTPLSGRTVTASYAPNGAGNAVLSPLVTQTNATGGFTVGLTDPAAPVAPETGTLTADTTFTPATNLAVSFEVVPPVTHIAVSKSNVFADTAPGKPVELNVVVRGQAVADDTPANDPILKDYPVKFAVDHGFLTPDPEGAGLSLVDNDLLLTADQDDEDDLFGFYQNLGADETVDTSDDAGTNAAGIVATIAKDAGFNDDGLVEQKVTITAGGKTATETISYDVRDYLNLAAVAFRKDGGSTRVPGRVDLKLYAADQFGNLVGDQPANISDNTPVARVTPEPGGATTDFVNDNPSAAASSSRAVTQVVSARVSADKNTVAANGNRVPGNENVTGNITLRWGKGGGQAGIIAKLTGKNNGGKADKLTVVAPKKANGAKVKLFKIVGGKLVPAGTKSLRNGKATFTKADKNGNGFTKYVAKVNATGDTKATRTNKRNVR